MSSTFIILLVRPSSFRKRARRGRSVDPGATNFPFPPGYQSSSDLSSPNETCYSFVRNAMKVQIWTRTIIIMSSCL